MIEQDVAAVPIIGNGGTDIKMNIIREGDYSGTDPVYRFNCYKCGCIWECHQSECIKNNFDKNFLPLYQYKCPCCEHLATGENVHDIDLRTCYKG